MESITLPGPFPSGAPAIFIDQAAPLGQPAAIIGCAGDDDFGRVNLNRRLRRDGVDVSGVRIDREVVTGSAFVRYQQRTDLAPSFSTSGTALRGALRSTVQRTPFSIAPTICTRWEQPFSLPRSSRSFLRPPKP